MGWTPKLSRGERLGALILVILMTLLVGTLAFRKGLLSSSTNEYRPVTVEYSDSAAGVSRRDSLSHKEKKRQKGKKGKQRKANKERSQQSRKGHGRDILDEEPLH